MKNHIALAAASAALATQPHEFVELFKHGTLSIELYKPDQIDHQQPHTRDEVYIIAAGSGSFFLSGETTSVDVGDFLFVPAGAEHRFLSFTDDFTTWVMFYGPEGGEKNAAT